MASFNHASASLILFSSPSCKKQGCARASSTFFGHARNRKQEALCILIRGIFLPHLLTNSSELKAFRLKGLLEDSYGGH